MKILDKYVVKNFLIGYGIAFSVLMGLRMIIDLFVNLDEFTEHADLGMLAVTKNVLVYYGLNSTLYFRDFAGMITVIAAAFSFGRMVRAQELVAVMASGVSLKRVIAPVAVLAIILTGFLVVDQEILIPSFANRLVRSEDTLPGEESYDVWFINDANGSLICSPKFDVSTATLHRPTIVTRRPHLQETASVVWEVTGRIDATAATYNPQKGRWDLTDGVFAENGSNKGLRPIAFFVSDITAKDIPIRRSSEHTALLSSRQLAVLAAQSTKLKDLAQLYSQKHFRITDPIFNLVMLLVCLPFLVCRDPKSMRSAIMISFGITGGCLITSFVCKLMATEIAFGNTIRPELWAWLPIFIFAPIAFIQLDSMKT